MQFNVVTYQGVTMSLGYCLNITFEPRRVYGDELVAFGALEVMMMRLERA